MQLGWRSWNGKKKGNRKEHQHENLSTKVHAWLARRKTVQFHKRIGADGKPNCALERTIRKARKLNDSLRVEPGFLLWHPHLLPIWLAANSLYGQLQMSKLFMLTVTWDANAKTYHGYMATSPGLWLKSWISTRLSSYFAWRQSPTKLMLLLK